MRSLFLLPLLLTLVLSSGCSSIQEQKMAFAAQEKIVNSQMGTVNNPTPTLELTCGSGIDSCRGLTMKFIHPADRHKLVVPRIRTANDVASDALPHLKDVLMFGAGAFAATRIVDDVMSGVGGGNTTTHNTTAINGDNNDTTATTSVSKSSHDGTTSSSTSNSDDDTTMDSNNTTDDNSVVTTTTSTTNTDSTHAPTVVTQPEPVVVQPSYPPGE